MKDTNLRSFTKGISWRAIGTIDTFIIAYFYLGDVKLAAPIAGSELITKIILYYLHERVWNVIKWGRKNNKPSHLRSISKGISWRFFGSMDTIFVSFIFSGSFVGAVKIGTTEVLTKVILYYLHERVWSRIKWGRIFEKN